MARRYWLMKTEPESFSISDLARASAETTFWDGVRNYQARNLIRDEMMVGDGVLFYHSNANPPAVVGTAEVVRAGYPDPTQFDPQSHHYDADARPAEPRWYMIDVKLGQVFKRAVGLPELRAHPALEEMVLLRKGSRLSVQPVTAKEWSTVVKLGASKAGPRS
jgi:predicted RNA-binding protein with PUA-like domain